MKTSFLCFVLTWLAAGNVLVHAAQTPTPAVNAVKPDPTRIALPSAYRVVDRGANYRVWQRETCEKSPSGDVVTNAHSYTELATGMHYQDSKCQWVESKEEIEAYSAGAIARQGQYQVIFANNLNSAGSIDQQTPDGKRLRSTVLGLSYYDTSSGQSVLIAELQDSQGELISANQVLYQNAFTGVKCDVRYTYKKGGFEQDVILREQPPPPEAFGLNSSTTEIEVMTEFIDPPTETIKERKGENTAPQDQDISWGAMRIGQGRAFALGVEPNQRSGVQVIRRYVTVDGRKILLEKVPFQKVESSLSNLPKQAGIKSKPSRTASKVRILPEAPIAQAQQKAMELAAVAPSNQGYVLDYVELNTDQNAFTFQGDTTYYISAPFNIDGTTSFEGGTVIKYALAGEIQVNGPYLCQTAPYRPAIFTSMNDDTVGETIGGSSGSPGQTDSVQDLYITSIGGQLKNLRFSYTMRGATQQGLNVWDCQFINCGEYGLSEMGSVSVLHNVLFANCPFFAIMQYSYGSMALVGEHITADQCGALINSGSSAYLTNSLLTAVATLPSTVTNNPTVVVLATNTGVFQAAGAGNYYLADNSLYRNAGTTNIDPDALADIRTKTTYPPIVYSNVAVSVDTTFSPQAHRDTDTPDLGYHYEPMDYFVDYFQITNAALTVTNGAVIASDNNSAGVWLQDGSSIISIGTPFAPNWFVRYSTVQEQSVSLGSPSPASAATINPYHVSNLAPAGLYRFTKFACPAAGGIHLYHTQNSWCYANLMVQDCEFWGGDNLIGGYSNTVATLKNNLFARCALHAANGAGSYLFLTNNLFWGVSSVSLNPAGSAGWYALNNAFDSCSSIDSGVVGMSNADYNAYYNCTGQLNPTNATDIFLASALAYQTGPLGGFYQPTDSPLVNMGSTTADRVGLYHFTTQASQTKETNSMVDIGYHYVALDTNGNPIDTNGDGIPDYLEDASGNGMFDGNELADWRLPVLSNGVLSFTNGLQILILEPKPTSNIP